MNLDEERDKEIKRLGWPPFPFRAEVDHDMLMFPIEGWVMSARIKTISLGGPKTEYRLWADVMTDDPVPMYDGDTHEVEIYSSHVRPINVLDRFIEEVNRPDGK